MLTDLLRTFDCLNHELLIAKPNGYGFTLPALKLVHDYLSGRKQRARVNNSYRTLSEILFGIPQGSILSPLLLNIFLTELLFILHILDIAKYVDDSSDDVSGLIKSLERVV